MTTWLALHNGLKTRDVLATNQIFHDPICVLCNCSPESWRHILTASSIAWTFGILQLLLLVLLPKEISPLLSRWEISFLNVTIGMKMILLWRSYFFLHLLGMYGVSATIGFPGIKLGHGKVSSMMPMPRFVQEQITSILRFLLTLQQIGTYLHTQNTYLLNLSHIIALQTGIFFSPLQIIF